MNELLSKNLLNNNKMKNRWTWFIQLGLYETSCLIHGCEMRYDLQTAQYLFCYKFNKKHNTIEYRFNRIIRVG